MNRRRGRIPLMMIILLFCVLWISCGTGENDFTLERAGQIVGYAENTFIVHSPETGSLTITISSGTSVYRRIVTDVEEGISRIEWDGLGFNREKFYPMCYHIDAYLSGVSGREYHTGFDSAIERWVQAMTLALTSSDKLYLDSPNEWFLECKVVMNGTLVTEMIPAGKDHPAYTFRTAVQPSRINRLTFSAIAGKTTIDPGQYTMRIYEMSNPSFSREFPVTAEAEKPAPAQIGITGKIMPKEGDSDDEIWQLMMQPAVVVDIASTNHQTVYAQPDAASPALGTLHGQTQSLCVIEIRNGWALVEAWNHEEGEKITGWVPAARLKVEYPRTEYGLLINKKEQTLTVFQNGKRIETILVCTGRMEKNELFQETAAGSFLTGEHRVDYSMNGQRFDYVIQYDGGNLIHQIPYAFGEGKKDFTEGRALLGGKGSHACIRVQAEPGSESGINAYWIWTHIPYHTRIIITDDPEERHAMKSILEGNVPESNPSESYIVEDEEDSVIMTFGGDAVLGGREGYFHRRDSLIAYLAENGSGYPLSGMIGYFGSDDLTSINLECVLKSDSEGENLEKTWRFRGLPEYAEILKEGSVELVNLANNHTYDYGKEGYLSTVSAVGEYAEWCGKDHPVAIDVKGHRFGFGGCRETEYKHDPEIIARDIQALKDMGCECIIYQCHWGREYSPHFNAVQQSMAHACVRAGADLVIGHHPHVIQGIDYIQGVPVIYSLGNLCFGGTIPLSDFDGILVRAEISFGDSRPKVAIRIIPIMTSSRAEEKINDFHPVPAAGADASRILRRVQDDSGVQLPR